MQRVELPDGGGRGRASVAAAGGVPSPTGGSGRRPPDGGGKEIRLLAAACCSAVSEADACLWVAHGGGVSPVFVMPDAHAVADRLVAWAGGRAGDWFALCYAESNGRFVAALVPNLIDAIGRFEANHPSRHCAAPSAAAYESLFRPVPFVSGTRHTSGRLRKMLAGPSMVGFLDRRDFDPAASAVLDLRRVRRVGPVPVCWDVAPLGFDSSPVQAQPTE